MTLLLRFQPLMTFAAMGGAWQTIHFPGDRRVQSALLCREQSTVQSEDMYKRPRDWFEVRFQTPAVQFTPCRVATGQWQAGRASEAQRIREVVK
jgi:hypothetical protein